jgi:DNA processing protein
MDDSEKLVYRIAFSRIKGMTLLAAKRFLELVGSEKEMFTLPLREIERLTGLGSRNFDDSVRTELLDHARNELRFIEGHSISTIYFTDEAYPQRLLECDDAPLLLYVSGKVNFNARYVIGIVGTRNATQYGFNFINKLVDDIAERLDDVLIISGLALGCDITAHRRAMKDHIPTAAVVAHGLDTIYPAENRNDAVAMACGGGAVVTDYTSKTRPFRGNFLARNRIVAGMVDCLIVAESAADHGGALHTARLAREYNREVFALPGRTSDHYSGGCNKLIRRQIAVLCQSADDILDTMGWEGRPVEGEQKQLFRELSPEEQLIIDYLRQNGDGQINTLTANTGIPVGRLMGMLMELEMDDLIMTLPGSRYRLK